ncbi:MAG: ABC transporter permease [Desulfobulbaceae bacterium]|nr:ABC transporter permease [Desulfobulbaceae bacterium]
MKKLINIYQLGAKELRSLFHDTVLLIAVIYSFSFGIYSAANGISHELHNTAIAIVDEDRSPLSRRIADAFRPPYFRQPQLIAIEAVDAAMDSGLYTFVIDIPPDFEKNVVAGRYPELQVNVDATAVNQAGIGDGYIQNIIGGEIREFIQGFRGPAPLPVELLTRVKFNPNLTTSWFVSVMELINNITLLSMVLTGAALMRERERGTIEHLLVMPLTPFEIMAAKVWANGLIVLVAAGLSLWLVITGLLQVQITGSIPLFLGGTALYLFSSTAMGIFFATVARSMPQLGLLFILIVLPMNILSGGSSPRESMPEILQTIMQFAPSTHFVTFAQAILYRGAGFAVVWPNYAAVSLIGAVFFIAALARLRKSITLSI